MKLQRWMLCLIVPSGALIVCFLLGMLVLVWFSLHFSGEISLGQYIDFFSRPDYRRVLLKTIIIACLTTLCCLLIAYPVAFAIARADRFRPLLFVLVVMPWLVSVIVRTYGWIVLLGNRGTINSALISMGVIERPIQLLFNDIGVLIGLTHVFSPFMVISILNVLFNVDRSLEEASMSLGAGPVKTFFKVVLPLTTPGIVSGCTLVFLLSTGAIVTPLLLGGPRSGMLATQIYQDVFQLFNFSKAGAMAVVLTLLAALLVIPFQMLERYVTRNMKPSDA